MGQLRFRIWGRKAERPNELKGNPPAVETRQDEKQEQKTPQKVQVPIAEKEKRKPSAHMNSVDIALDRYDDIFSDFDPSPYKMRLLSRDFLEEISRRNRETKAGEIEVRLTLPKGKRNPVVESIIRERLVEYYKGRAQKAGEEIRAREKKGWKYMGIGITLNIAGMLIVHFLESISVGFRVGGGLIEMAGWISTWVGAERAVMEAPKEMMEQKEFYERMARASFVFISEEEIVKRIEKASVDGAGKKEEKPRKSAETPAAGAPAAEAAAPSGPASAGAGGEASG